MCWSNFEFFMFMFMNKSDKNQSLLLLHHYKILVGLSFPFPVGCVFWKSRWKRRHFNTKLLFFFISKSDFSAPGSVSCEARSYRKLVNKWLNEMILNILYCSFFLHWFEKDQLLPDRNPADYKAKQMKPSRCNIFCTPIFSHLPRYRQYNKSDKCSNVGKHTTTATYNHFRNHNYSVLPHAKTQVAFLSSL